MTKQTATAPELLPCAHCGSHAHLRQTVVSSSLTKDFYAHWVECVICEIGTKFHDSPETAAKTWNTRTRSPADLSAVVDERSRALSVITPEQDGEQDQVEAGKELALSTGTVLKDVSAKAAPPDGEQVVTWWESRRGVDIWHKDRKTLVSLIDRAIYEGKAAASPTPTDDDEPEVVSPVIESFTVNARVKFGGQIIQPPIDYTPTESEAVELLEQAMQLNEQAVGCDCDRTEIDVCSGNCITAQVWKLMYHVRKLIYPRNAAPDVERTVLREALQDLFDMVNSALDSRDALLISKTCATMEKAAAALATPEEKP